MKRIPWTAFFSMTMPDTGERNVRVRRASPDWANARTCSSEMSQFLSRARLESARRFMLACGVLAQHS